ncbi:MAG: hypothetical protein LV481_11025 [Methylacidiphilales bacterium]|nr:hypothetical protein [Candidatus Methylacidiphilales bacterium]
MATVGFIVAWLLFLLAIVVALVNWLCFFRNYRNRVRGVAKHHSIIPALGFFLLIIAGLICPRGPGVWIVVPVMLDPGTWVVIVLPFVMLRAWLSRKT